MTMKELFLYVVDDDQAVRRSLELLLLSKGYAVQAFESGEAFLERVNLQQAGCVILDVRMQGLSGLQVFDVLRTNGSPLVVLFLSGHGDIPMAVGALQNGAFGWLEKPCSEAQLLEKVQLALALAEKLAQRQLVINKAQTLWQRLTNREREVARYVAEGNSSKEIARKLTPTCDPRTIETHRSRVFAKLELANSNELDRFIRDHAL